MGEQVNKPKTEKALEEYKIANEYLLYGNGKLIKPMFNNILCNNAISLG